MTIYTFFICVLLISVSDIKLVSSRSSYDNPSYASDRNENLPMLSSHQKKTLVNEYVQSIHEDPNQETYERGGGPLYENRYRKYQPEAYARRDSRMDRQGRDEYEEKVNPQKREYYDAPSSAKDASIEVILDPRAKKAVAVVENSPNGQAMYDLTGWKNKEENSPYETDQYSQGNQEQVVNLVYPAERAERKYSPDAFEQNSDYSDKVMKGVFKDKMVDTERAVDETHKRKRNVDLNKSDNLKRNAGENNIKKKSDNSKSDASKASNDCPPHNVQSSVGTGDNKNTNENKFEKQRNTAKREAPQWTQEQVDALKTSLAHVKDTSGEIQNLKNILSNMGLFDNLQMKREAKKVAVIDKIDENKEKMSSDLQTDTEDEDLNKDNIILKRNDREINDNFEDDLINAPQEPVEKRDIDESENYEEDEENDETFGVQDEKKDIKRSNDDNPKEEQNVKAESDSRKKRQNADNLQKLSDNAKNNNPTDSEASTNNEDVKKYAKRDANRDMRKNREDKETDEEYEKRMENQIQAKIDAIKEKVKREILEEQLKKRFKRNPTSDTEVLKIRKRRQSKDENARAIDNPSNKEKDVVLDNLETQSKIVRKKRANSLSEKQMAYRGYQAEQDEDTEDDGEFDDNAFDGRMYVEKRHADDENDYFDPVRKREVENYLRQYYPDSRNRRSFGDGYAQESNAFHGNPISSNRRAIKSKIFNEQENQQDYNAKSNENNDNFDNEYFGSLPQSYNGELTRYKRVKRDNPYI